jgi:hypothetical protein
VAGDLSGVRKKLNQAKAHLEALNAEVDRAEHGHLYALAVEPDAERGYYLVKLAARGTADQWALILGDTLHNLRSTLDHLVWQLVVANGHQPGSLNEFPIAIHESWFNDHIDPYLVGVHDDAITAIRGLQPFRVSDEGQRKLDPLWLLSKLENIDKHRLVHVFALIPEGTSLHFDERFPITDPVEFFDLSERPVQHGTEIARVHLDREPKVEMDSHLALLIFVEETKDTPRLEWGVLDAMVSAVDDTVRALTSFVVWPPK